ncbi:Coenzyme F420 hydrogenase/dehydrogenase, beta subunit C-terminal domain [Amphibacillus jilinensis]|uniref:Coenzyme F420 hydrogenase/dehydrogenase, beta subunit C-terminal domain n=1 Tax=Amphibacillus jilinensis TaxID=1216008 RepID=UPI00031F88F8|nr:Coenzyme F420 hydrogenase/dehydrogenase, beta subunit C-terminal domain [Amphibacillus jilinensis]
MKVAEFNVKKRFSEASGSCAVVDDNIKMELNKYGVYEETVLVNEDYELDSIVEYVSPNLNEEINESEIAEKLYDNIKEINYDKRIGYYISLYAGYVNEGDYREKASSGGMGTWIFKELFEKKLIDGVIHVKENPEKNSPIMFQYDISRSIDEIRAGAKTKYYPVEFSRVLKIVKEVPGRYAIVGIPSFIMAIRLLAEKDEVIKNRIKYTVGLICGHQKSSKFAEAIAWQVGIKPGNLKYINFRKKLLDKPANNYGVEITGLIDGNEVTTVKSTKELLGQNWGQGYFKTKASDFTDDVMNETADITLGDAWLQEYTKDSRGNNVIVVRNPVIDDLIKEGIESGKLNLDIVDKEIIFRSQAAHYRHTHDELAYRLYKRDKANEWKPKKRVEASNSVPLLRRKVQDLREEISTQSHLVYKKAVELDDLDYFKTEMGKLSRRYNQLYKLILIQKKGITGVINAIIRKVSKKISR